MEEPSPFDPNSLASSIDGDDNFDEVQEVEESQTYEIVTELSHEARLKMEAIQNILAASDRKTRGQRIQEATQKLGVTTRTIQRLLKKYEEKGLSAITLTERADKGYYRIDPKWQEFIIKTYKEGNKGSSKMTPAQVALRVAAEADNRGEQPPSQMTVYRVLNPLIEKQERKQKVRNTGWKGTKLAHKTRDGQTLDIKYSNQVWQCDHTKLDIMLVDQNGEVLSRPWLTKITDSYSRCIMGIHLGFDAPSSQVGALALRHAILPKRYELEFNLHCDWGTYGVPEHLFTDGGKDFKSDHLKQIAFQLGFEHHLRDRPSEGGIEERSFGTINTAFLSGFEGYLGSNIQERPKTAEADACLTLKELHILLVRYIVDNYNQRIDARTGHQTRFQRWESGLSKIPALIPERELDICLHKQTRRTIYRGGTISFNNILYRKSVLAGYAGENVILRYDPRDITTVWVYRVEKGKEVFLAAAHAIDLETEHLSFDELKLSRRHLKEQGKAISNQSIYSEVRSRDAFIKEKKKSRQTRKKEEQGIVHPAYKTPKNKFEFTSESTEEILSQPEAKSEQKRPKIFNYEQLMEDYKG